MLVGYLGKGAFLRYHLGTMVSASIGVLVLGATMGIHIEGVKDVPKKELGAILKRLKKGFEAKGDKVKLDRKVGPCIDSPECVAQVRTRTKAQKILFLKLTKGTAKANKLVTTIVFKDNQRRKIGVKIPIKRSIWDKLFPKLVSKLYKLKPKPGAAVAKASGNSAAPPIPGASSSPPPVPGASAAPPAVAASPAATSSPNLTQATVESSSGFSWAPWATIAGSLVAGGAGIYFGLQSSSARTSALSASHEVAEIEALNDDIYVNGMTANALLGTAVVGIATGVVLFFID